MRRAGLLIAFMTAVLFGGPAAVPAAEPERLSSKLFDVVVGAGPVLDITFALTLSDVSTYPVTITAIAGSVEEPLWDGTLPEGSYRLRAPLTKIKSGPLRVVLRTKMTNLMAARKPTKPEESKPPAKPGEVRPPAKEATGSQSYYVYQRWEGTIK